VLERFPRLRFGVIEQGAAWVPSFMRFMDSAFDAFRRGEERLQKLSLRPSEYVRRQVRATPYPMEDVGWITREAGDGICLFSSDYPHVEGGRNPIKRFEESLEAAGVAEAAKQRFYHDNFVDLMGAGLAHLPKRVAMPGRNEPESEPKGERRGAGPAQSTTAS
jgi:predicted TIM-barrel fold metal-dependent hydrolase